MTQLNHFPAFRIHPGVDSGWHPFTLLSEVKPGLFRTIQPLVFIWLRHGIPLGAKPDPLLGFSTYVGRKCDKPLTIGLTKL